MIIPNQKIVVDDLKAGRIPDAKYGEIAKLRSTHNNYLTLPVLFMMISNHYPMTFGHKWNWVIVALVLALGAIVRHWFNMHEAGKRGVEVQWQWPLSGALVALLIAFTAWKPGPAVAVPDKVVTADAMAIVHTRCAVCHSAHPSNPDFTEAPGGIKFDTAAEVKAMAQKILAQAVNTDAMPLGNITKITPEERAKLGAWIKAGTPDS